MGKCVKKKEIEGGFYKIQYGVWTSGEPFEKFRDPKIMFES